MRLRGLLGVVFDLISGLAHAFTRGVRRLLRDLLAVLECLFARLLRLLFDLVGDRPKPFVLDPRGWDEHPGEEAG